MTDTLSGHRIRSDVKKAYDSMAPTYTAWTQPTHETRLHYLKDMLQSLGALGDSQSRKFNVLELGCGAGLPCTSFMASLNHIHVTANDISDAQIALARERLPPSVDLVAGDMTDLRFDPEQSDAVVAMYSLFHLPCDEQSVMLRRIFGWLKPGGRLLANFTETGFEMSSRESWLGSSEGAMYWSGWGRTEMQRLLVDVGFELEIDELVEDAEKGDDGEMHSVKFHWVLAKKGI